MSNAKQFVFDTVERNREAIALLCDNIFYFAELGMQEFETSKLMMSLLENAGQRSLHLKSACSRSRPTTPARCPGSCRPGLITFSSNIPCVSYHHWSAGRVAGDFHRA
jgi:hypothetical protein